MDFGHRQALNYKKA